MKRALIALALYTAASVAGADTPETALLEARSAEFRKDVVQVADNVYTFTGYSVQVSSHMLSVRCRARAGQGQTIGHRRRIVDGPLTSNCQGAEPTRKRRPTHGCRTAPAARPSAAVESSRQCGPNGMAGHIPVGCLLMCRYHVSAAAGCCRLFTGHGLGPLWPPYDSFQRAARTPEYAIDGARLPQSRRSAGASPYLLDGRQ